MSDAPAPAWLDVVRGDAPLLVSVPHTGLDLENLEPRLVSPWLARKDADWWIDRLYDFAADLQHLRHFLEARMGNRGKREFIQVLRLMEAASQDGIVTLTVFTCQERPRVIGSGEQIQRVSAPATEPKWPHKRLYWLNVTMPVNVRYPRDLRSDPQSIARDVLVAMPAGGTVPLGDVAKVRLARGPTSIRTENGQLALYIFVDMHGRDLGGYVADAQKAVADNVHFPPGTYVQWSGQFEYLERATEKLKIVVPVTLLIIFLLLYLNFGRLAETLIVMLSLPLALVGGLWLMWWLGFNMSVAVVVGFIALSGVAAETGVVMLIYLDQALHEVRTERESAGRRFTRADLNEAIMLGAVERVRPKMMTVVAIMAGLVPIMWSTGTGSEVMPRIAVPMIGGMVSSTLLTLIVIPAIYALVKGWGLPKAGSQPIPVADPDTVEIRQAAE